MFVNVNGVRLHAVVFGDGPRTLVATGGWTGSWEVWEEPIGLLTAAGWRCIAYDHRGSGESPVDPALITVDAMTDDVLGVLDALGIETCVLAGESQGGAIAQYACRPQSGPVQRAGSVRACPDRAQRGQRGLRGPVQGRLPGGRPGVRRPLFSGARHRARAPLGQKHPAARRAGSRPPG